MLSPVVQLRSVSPHLVCLLKVFYCIGDDLAIGGMIDGLDANYFGHQAMLMLVRIFDELKFRCRWTDDQNFHGIRERARDFLKKFTIVLRMRLGAARIAWVLMVNWPMGFQCLLIHLVGVDVKDPRLAVIDPNGNVFCHNKYILKG